MKIAFIGLGRMGWHMAGPLAERGAALGGCSLTRRQRLVQGGL
jgi:3-hydroxyisobutyrate dehydrogenase-like beta-hydroxyacid dehydrogenase